MTDTHTSDTRTSDTHTSDARMGGAAMIAAAIAGIITMALHPTSRDMFVPGHVSMVATLGWIIHIFAIISTPFAFLGALALARYMDAPNRIAIAALAIYGVALVAIVIAPTLSGLVAIPIIQKIVLEPQSAAQWEPLATYTGYLNQAFARIYTLLAAIAIALWSIPMVRTRILSRGTGIYGLVISPLIFIVVGSGHVKLDVHGFGAVVLLQGIWFVAIGAALYRTSSRPPAAA